MAARGAVPLVALARTAMRTRFEIVIADDRDPVQSRAAAEAALDEIERVEGELSVFRPDSQLARLNAEAAAGPVRVDQSLFAFLRRAGTLSAKLEGAFDPTVGAILSVLRRRGGVAELARAVTLVGFRKQVRLDARAMTVSFRRAGVALDPGAIGKGYAIERAVERLRDGGVCNAILHGGTSSVHALGAPPGAAGWGVAVQDPDDGQKHVARVLLRNQSLSVSTIAGRTFKRRGAARGHVVDPRTGASVSHTALAAVVMDAATDADAVSTGLLVLGSGALRTIGKRFPGASFLCVSAAVAHDDKTRIFASGAAFAA